MKKRHAVRTANKINVLKTGIKVKKRLRSSSALALRGCDARRAASYLTNV